jgi:hypothetical protein
LRGTGTKIRLYDILKLHTLLSTFLRGTGTKIRLYDILKLHTQHDGNQNGGSNLVLNTNFAW